MCSPRRVAARGVALSKACAARRVEALRDACVGAAPWSARASSAFPAHSIQRTLGVGDERNVDALRARLRSQHACCAQRVAHRWRSGASISRNAKLHIPTNKESSTTMNARTPSPRIRTCASSRPCARPRPRSRPRPSTPTAPSPSASTAASAPRSPLEPASSATPCSGSRGYRARSRAEDGTRTHRARGHARAEDHGTREGGARGDWRWRCVLRGLPWCARAASR